AYGSIFLRNTLASGVIPQISVILGPAAGGAVYSPAITDFIFMVRGIGQMYITGPDVIKAVTGEDVSHEDLGGALSHATKSGVAHFAIDTEEECLAQVRRLLSFLPQNNMEDPVPAPFQSPIHPVLESLAQVVPDDPNKPYDMKEIITGCLDNGDFIEVHALYAPNIVVGYGRLNGRTVGIVANQPMSLAGALDIEASMKSARFIRFCDAFNIPIITFVDVPGYMPGTDQEFRGIIKHGAKMLYAYAEATVPKISVILRKAYGGAYIVMSSRFLRSDINYAWPTSEIAVMGASGAVNIISRDAIKNSKNPDETRKKLIAEYEERFSNPYVAAARGYVDEVIDPAETRYKLVQALEALASKRDTLPAKKHGNIPL
ncbi:MAG: acyl-CoA carboxylase subunit beta, partial [Chloroflexi bacterium]|nr:acyl-CoA carboxylase subunit beta [Chloroflexota bacterium]